MTVHPPMPPWLQHLLETTGALNADGVSRKARTRYCRTCGVPTVVGLDADRAALAVRCDVVPLSSMGEVLTLLAGRRTFDLAWINGSYRLDGREHYQIASTPPETSSNSVVAAHDCGADALPPAGYLVREYTTKTKTSVNSDAQPPF